MLDRIHVMGAYWRDDSDLPTPLGELIAAAKDHHSEPAVTKLQEQLSDFVGDLDLNDDLAGAGKALAIPVPVFPGNNGRLVLELANTVASATDAVLCEALVRRNPTARLRDTAPDLRLAVVEAAGYEVVSPVSGRVVILVDDIVLTGTTLRYLARQIRDAGATRVVAVVAARTRRADPDVVQPPTSDASSGLVVKQVPNR